jgi:cellulose synthase/poly-beta-1,6-N-acetylglucosamine synthase-like glycosyltransferase
MLKTVIITAIIIGLFGAFLVLMPSRQSYLSYTTGIGLTLFFIIHFMFSARDKKKRIGLLAFWIPVVSLSSLFFLLPVFFAAALYMWDELSVFSWVLLLGLTLVLYFNFMALPLVIYHKMREEKMAKSAPFLPSVSVLIPAYNEEKVLARTLETVIEATYHGKEVIVIDDGSSDRTLQIARSFSRRGVKVIHRPNGGKASALNHGLLFARGEVIIIVDADSQVCKNTLIDLVQPLRDPDVAAVAGNIKVLNRKNWLTGCQALEYIISINIYRRALDVFGSVTVVPGALGAYRRQILVGGGQYDPDTLVEDFDVTIKALKTGKVVQASSNAVSYTEAPQKIADLIKQRLRWYRGNFQALWKHHDAAINSRYGFLQKLSFPFMFLSMVFLPLAGIVNFVAVACIIARGEGMFLLPAFLFFSLLQFMLSLLAIHLDNDDWKLALYSPLFIFGYKQLCDFVIAKSLFDVLFRKRLKWTSIRRTGAQMSRKMLYTNMRGSQ